MINTCMMHLRAASYVMVISSFRDTELSMKNHLLSLTPDHVARAHRAIADPGPEAHIVYHSDADYEAIVQDIRVPRPTRDGIRLFADGSLIWKPEVDHPAEQSGVARGWHRSFCFEVARVRGSREQPGLTMALDRGGQQPCNRTDHERQSINQLGKPPRRPPWNKEKLVGPKPATAIEPRLVHSDKAAHRRTRV
jgi:hypothetical protein